MRRAGILVLGAGIIAVALGCTKHFQYTAGVCDCDPEPVESVLVPYHGRPQAQPVAMTPSKTEQLPGPPKRIDEPKTKPPKRIDDEPKNGKEGPGEENN